MATSLRFSINCLHKHLSRVKLVSSPGYIDTASLASFTKFSRSKSRNVRSTKVSSLALERDWGEESTVLEEAEDHFLEHGLEKEMKTDRELLKDNIRMKMAIIRTKYFKPEQEWSLLTWQAAEQIHYLHNTMPDIWTVEKLAQSFPCTEIGISRILQSSYQPRTHSEKERYNKRARKNWTMLKACMKNKADAAAVAAFQHILEDNKLHLLLNAGGIEDLPSSSTYDSKNKKFTPSRVGEFESIIKNYKDEVYIKKQISSGDKEKTLKAPDRELLVSIVEMDKHRRLHQTPSLSSGSAQTHEYTVNMVDDESRNLTEIIFSKKLRNQRPRSGSGRKRGIPEIKKPK